MAPQLSEDEVDDLIYYARAGEQQELEELLGSLAGRTASSAAEILLAARDDGKSTCLHMAAGNGHSEIVKLLVQAFAGRPQAEIQTFLDAQNEFGNTALNWAALGGHLATVQELMGHGASPVLANDRNYIPLDSANLNGHDAVAQYFLSFSASIESGNQSGLNGAVEAVQVDGVEEAGGTEEGEGSAT